MISESTKAAETAIARDEGIAESRAIERVKIIYDTILPFLINYGDIDSMRNEARLEHRAEEQALENRLTGNAEFITNPGDNVQEDTEPRQTYQEYMRTAQPGDPPHDDWELRDFWGDDISDHEDGIISILNIIE